MAPFICSSQPPTHRAKHGTETETVPRSTSIELDYWRRQGRRTKVVVELIDMWKTIVDLGGLPYDNRGRDFYS